MSWAYAESVPTLTDSSQKYDDDDDNDNNNNSCIRK
jgi:hypothetical protein